MHPLLAQAPPLSSFWPQASERLALLREQVRFRLEAVRVRRRELLPAAFQAAVPSCPLPPARVQNYLRQQFARADRPEP